jgi:hypothetical protein
MSKFVVFLTVLLVGCSSTSTNSSRDELKFKLNVSKNCEVFLSLVEGVADSDEIDSIEKTILDRFVKDDFDVDMDAVKQALPEIDFSKKILTVDEGRKAIKVSADLGPWSFTRNVRLLGGKYIECSFSEAGDFESLVIGELPQSFEIGYVVEYGN